MKVCWVVAHEKLEWNPAEPKLTEAIERAGIPLFKATYSDDLQYLNGHKRYVYDDFSEYDIAIVHGPIQFVRQLQAEKHKNLYIYGFNNNVNFSTYTANVTDLPFLNEDYVILPYGRIESNIPVDWRNIDLFVRPNSGFKPFTGFVVPSDNRDEFLNNMAETLKIAKDELCVVAPKAEIKAEFRFIIRDHEVIAASQYCWDDRKDVRIDVTDDALRLAKEVSRHAWQPDTIYVVDVAVDWADCHRIIEYNSFSSSGLYACDRDSIVKHVTRSALLECGIED